MKIVKKQIVEKYKTIYKVGKYQFDNEYDAKVFVEYGCNISRLVQANTIQESYRNDIRRAYEIADKKYWALGRIIQIVESDTK